MCVTLVPFRALARAQSCAAFTPSTLITETCVERGPLARGIVPPLSSSSPTRTLTDLYPRFFSCSHHLRSSSSKTLFYVSVTHTSRQSALDGSNSTCSKVTPAGLSHVVSVYIFRSSLHQSRCCKERACWYGVRSPCSYFGCFLDIIRPRS